MSSVRAMDNILHKLMDETSTFIYAWWSRPLCDGNQQIQENKKKILPWKVDLLPFQLDYGVFFNAYTMNSQD